jgi:hypothetical protein
VRRFLLLPAVLVVLLAACSGGSDGSPPASASKSSLPDPEQLDCGSGVAGSEAALRQFFAILWRGHRVEVRSVLVDRPRFAWLAVNSNANIRRGPHINVRGHPGKAAPVVARHGGLPLRITEFMNSEPPRRSTDFGFRGRWNGTRPLVGKAAIDCTEGRAIVLGVGVRRAR